MLSFKSINMLLDTTTRGCVCMFHDECATRVAFLYFGSTLVCLLYVLCRHYISWRMRPVALKCDCESELERCLLFGVESIAADLIKMSFEVGSTPDKKSTHIVHFEFKKQCQESYENTRHTSCRCFNNVNKIITAILTATGTARVDNVRYFPNLNGNCIATEGEKMIHRFVMRISTICILYF